MKLKKVISMVLASAMVVGMLAGCGNKTNADTTPTPTATEAPAATKAPAAQATATPVPTEAPAKIEEDHQCSSRIFAQDRTDRLRWHTLLKGS